MKVDICFELTPELIESWLGYKHFKWKKIYVIGEIKTTGEKGYRNYCDNIATGKLAENHYEQMQYYCGVAKQVYKLPVFAGMLYYTPFGKPWMRKFTIIPVDPTVVQRARDQYDQERLAFRDRLLPAGVCLTSDDPRCKSCVVGHVCFSKDLPSMLNLNEHTLPHCLTCRWVKDCYPEPEQVQRIQQGNYIDCPEGKFPSCPEWDRKEMKGEDDVAVP